MAHLDPTPYVQIYVVFVFVGPWAVYISHLYRELRFARSKGIVGRGRGWWVEYQDLRRFRREDPEARHLFGLVKRWLKLTMVIWIVGFVVLGATIFILDRTGVLFRAGAGGQVCTSCKRAA